VLNERRRIVSMNRAGTPMALQLVTIAGPNCQRG